MAKVNANIVARDSQNFLQETRWIKLKSWSARFYHTFSGTKNNIRIATGLLLSKIATYKLKIDQNYSYAIRLCGIRQEIFKLRYLVIKRLPPFSSTANFFYLSG